MTLLPSVSQSFAPDFLRAIPPALDHLIADVPGVRSAVVATGDGFELAVASNSGLSGERLAALSSSMLALAQASLRELKIGGTGSVLVESSGGRLLIAEAATQSWPVVLCVAADGETVAGKLLWAARRCVAALEAASAPATEFSTRRAP